MNTKLTLRLDEKLIRQAKEYAKGTGKSVSQIVADYFSLLVSRKGKEVDQLTPTVKHLKGLLHKGNVNTEDYYEYLEDKYL